MKALFKPAARKSLAAAIMLLAFCVTLVAAPAQAAVVVNEGPYETVTLFNKADIESYTGIAFTRANVSKIRVALTQKSAWEQAGYSAAHASLIARRFALSASQATGILTSMTYNDMLHLKVIVVDKPYHTSANIGSQSYYEHEKPVVTPDPGDGQDPGTDPGTEPGEITVGELKQLQIEVQYGKKEIEIQYQVKSGGRINAEYQNELTGEKLSGAAAQRKLQPLLEGIDFRTASHNEIESHVLSFLGQSAGYKSFAFEAEFTDGSEVEFER